jgi:Radical SAM superfamily
MANILLTQSCVRSCPYCFARKHMEDSPPQDVLHWEDLLYLADLLETSHERNASLLGGEPTLHPSFVDFVIYLLERDFHVTVFTSGLLSERRLEEAERCLRGVSPERLSFVVNVNDPGICTAAEIAKLDRFLESLAPHCSLGFNMYRADFDLAFLMELINAHGLRRHLRLGLAHPIPGEANACIAPEDLPRAAARLLEFLPRLRRLRITIGFDCGLPLCLFTAEQLGALHVATHANVHNSCGPAIDIGPDMTVWSCFPLSGFHRKSVFEFDSIPQIREYYEGLHRQVRAEAGGLFAACDTCEHRETGLCQGGCLAHVLGRMRSEPRVRAEVVYS